MNRRLRVIGYGIGWSACLLNAWTPPSAWATAYNTGVYGGCTYNCSAATSIITETSGLRLAINLTSGQHIPLAGYLVIVSPLNGAGSSIRRVDFLINNDLVFTGWPDGTGTVYWHWLPTRPGAVRLQLVVEGLDDNKIMKDFILHIDATPSRRINITPPHRSSITWFPALAWSGGGTVIVIVGWKKRRKLIKDDIIKAKRLT